MVQPTTLKRRHTLKDTNLICLVKKIRDANVPKQYARVTSSQPLETMSAENIKSVFKELTGEELGEVLTMADRDDTQGNARLALHSAVILANEIGAPKGQQLAEEQDGPAPMKRQKTGGQDMEERVDDLKKKARLLALQKEPSEALILLTLEELASVSRRHSYADAETVEELYRQASRHQGEVNIAALCLSVLNKQASDLVSKALAKCLKTKEVEKQDAPKESSPLAGLYPQMPQAQWPMLPPAHTGFGYPYSFGHTFRPRYKPRGGRSPFRPRGACLFCDSTEHQVKDCMLMKRAKQKN